MEPSIAYKCYCRLVQGTMRTLLCLLPWNQTKKTFKGAGAYASLPEFIRQSGFQSVLYCTSGFAVRSGMTKTFSKICEDAGIRCAVYDGVVPNPAVQNIEDGVKVYKDNGCDVILAVGGGSVLDCAKGIGARIARPNRTVKQLRGNMKILKQTPPIIAVPTTSGTGSEATIVSVVTDTDTHEKYTVIDPSLMPRYVVLDPELTVNVPSSVTASTGMDALTHAVESYIGGENTRQTKADAVEAIKLINEYLPKSYTDGKDIEAREKMQYASYLAGKAFTRAYVGYVHAIAHAVGGMYGVAHGLANAVILPHVLTEYGAAARKKLAELAEAIGLTGQNDEGKAAAFIERINTLNAEMNIPSRLVDKDGNAIVKREDIPTLTKRILKEANPMYPCPEIWGSDEVQSVFDRII